MNKSTETRQRNLEARTALCKEKSCAVRSARLALTKVLEDERTTPEEAIRAAELLIQIGER